MKEHTTPLKDRGGRRKSYATMVREAGNGILPTAQDLFDERLTELGQRVMLALLIRQARMAAGPREIKELAILVRCSASHLSRVLHGRAKITPALNDLLSVALPEARIPRFAAQPPQLQRATVALRAKRIAHRMREREELEREKRFLAAEAERAELVRWAEETGQPEALVGLPPLEVPPRIAEARAYVGQAPGQAGHDAPPGSPGAAGASGSGAAPTRTYAPEVKAQVEQRLAARAAERAAVEDLRNWRLYEARISYAEAANLVGLTLRQIRFLELGDRRARPETREVLAAFVGQWRADHAPFPAGSDASAAEPPPAHPLPDPARRPAPPPGSGASS